MMIIGHKEDTAEYPAVKLYQEWPLDQAPTYIMVTKATYDAMLQENEQLRRHIAELETRIKQAGMALRII